jgi:hypothetical protein
MEASRISAMRRLRIATSLALFWIALATSGATRFEIGATALRPYWVDPINGNDANDGSTELKPFKTINAAVEASSSSNNGAGGYEIILRQGDYPDGSFVLGIRAAASRELPTVLRAEVPGTAILHGFLTVQGSHVYILGVTIHGPAGGNAIIAGNTDYLLLRDVHAVGAIDVNFSTHTHLESVQVENGSVTISHTQYGHAVGNRISATGSSPCFTLGAGSAYFTVDSNDIGPCGPAGAVALGQTSSLDRLTSPWIHYETYGVKVINNIVHDPGGRAFTVAGAYDALIAHNTVVTNSLSAFLFARLAPRTCSETRLCGTMHAAGGWGPTIPPLTYGIPNRNVTVSANIFYVRSSFPQQLLIVPQAPDFLTDTEFTNIPWPARSDDNLIVRGNVIWAPQSLLLPPFPTACENSNPTCNWLTLVSNNQINTFEPQLLGNYRPSPNGNLFGLPAVTIAPFTWSDAPTTPPVPPGDLVNSVATDADNLPRTTYVPGAFTRSMATGRGRAVGH